MKNTNFVNGTIALSLIITLLGSPCGVFAAKKQKEQPTSVNFITFSDSEYHTSPDKRIGAKILVDPAKVGPSISSMIHLTYLPGAHIGSHRHVFVTETLYVLEGNLTLRIGEEIKVLGPNSTAYIPAKSFHEYLNDSTDVVKFLQYYSPSGPEEEYRNWTKPSAEAAVTSAAGTPGNATESYHVITKALPPVPGSPAGVKLGKVEEKEVKITTPDAQKAAAKTILKTPPAILPASASKPIPAKSGK